MAAVAAEPGASAATSTTSREGADLEHEVVQPVTVEARLKGEGTQELASVMDLLHNHENGDAAQECGVDHTEAQCRPVPEAVGKAHCNVEEDERVVAGSPEGSAAETALQVQQTTETGGFGDLGREALNLNEALSLNAGAVNEVSSCHFPVCYELAPGSEPAGVATVQLLPVPSVSMETGLVAPFLSFLEPTETVRACTPPVDAADVECDVRAISKPPSPEPSPQLGMDRDAACPDLESACSQNDALHSLHTTPRITTVPAAEPKEEHADISACDFTVAVDHILGASGPDHFHTLSCDSSLREAPLKPTVVDGTDKWLPTESVAGLTPGSEVRVSLDHIIDDALVVSFRLGEKIFSGVLMDLSKRFGPYGIPVTVFPKREYRDKPESMQLKLEPVPPDLEKVRDQDAPGSQPEETSEAPSLPAPVPEPSPTQWTSKPPPLFQDGAPYPPPLFIRDTYSQSIPQPPPRKIKRPKRKLYREEPTSIMNAIRLRPRQVLCDKCKGVVVGTEKREVRRGPGSDCRAEDAKRRRGDGVTGVGKRPRAEPRAEERGRSGDGPRKQVTTVGNTKGPGMAKVVPPPSAAATISPPASSPRVQLNSKKVLQSKNVDHSKAREVFKMARVAHKRQRDKADSGSGARTPMTRASSPQDAHQKVHFTRRLHQISRGGGACVTNNAPLPPRIRIRPQRYRNEENSSSACKTLGLEKGPGSGGRATPKSAPTRCATSRSSCTTIPPVVIAENHSLARELEPENSPQVLPQSQPEPHPELEPISQPKLPRDPRDSETEVEELGGQEERRDRRGTKASSLTVYMSLNPSQPDSSSVSVCSVDSADDLKSSNSECSSTETFDLSPPGALHLPPVPSTSSIVTASSTTPSFSPSSSSKEDKKPSKPLKAAVFSKNVSKCVTADGRTICVGDIVWAKIYGFPWWPARILVITVSRKDNGLLVRQEARISWFGSPTTSFLALSQVTPFLENFQSRFDKKRKGLYRKAIAEAAKAAKQLTPEVRALLTQFET